MPPKTPCFAKGETFHRGKPPDRRSTTAWPEPRRPGIACHSQGKHGRRRIARRLLRALLSGGAHGLQGVHNKDCVAHARGQHCTLQKRRLRARTAAAQRVCGSEGEPKQSDSSLGVCQKRGSPLRLRLRHAWEWLQELQQHRAAGHSVCVRPLQASVHDQRLDPEVQEGTLCQVGLNGLSFCVALGANWALVDSGPGVAVINLISDSLVVLWEILMVQ